MRNKFKLGFMSSVVPKYDVSRLIDTADKQSYDYVELRTDWGHAHGISKDSTLSYMNKIRTIFGISKVAISCIATGVRLVNPYNDRIDGEIGILKHYVDSASYMGVPNVRFFCDPLPKTYAEVKPMLKRASDILNSCAHFIRDFDGNMCLETHGNLTASYAMEILDNVDFDNIYINWHAMHHVRYGESVEDAYQLIKDKIRHVHLHLGNEYDTQNINAVDSECIETLIDNEYDGHVSIESISPDDPLRCLEWHRGMFEKHF